MRDGQGAGGRARQDIWVPSLSDLCPRVFLDSLGTQDRLPGPHSGEGLFSPVPSTQTRAPTYGSLKWGVSCPPDTAGEGGGRQQGANPPTPAGPSTPTPPRSGLLRTGDSQQEPLMDTQRDRQTEGRTAAGKGGREDHSLLC